jgi:peptidoglycan/xylan/chitin deacetylase (PgdA/CDA1 family)
MDYLEKNGYHTVTLEQIYAAMAGMAELPTKPVVITFDDGGLDDYTVAFPILRAHHFTATFFVITGFVGKSICVSWQDLRAMRADGMEIESQTVRHPDLTTVSSTRLSQELSDSRTALVQNLNETPIALAYPSGAFNQQVEAAVREAGYLVAVTTRPGRVLNPGSSYAWPRLRVASDLSITGFARLVGRT